MNQTEQKTQDISPEEGWQPRDIFMAVAAFVVIVVLAAGGYLFYESRKAPPVDIGSEAPNFTYPTLKGGEVSLSDYKGKVVLVNIWATWCTPCREEMPSMEKLYKQFKGKPFEILAVSIDTRGSTDVEPFVNKLGLTFPILLDADKEIEGLYQTSGVPESFIIDKEGNVAQRIIGPLDWASPVTEEYMLIQHLVDAQ